MAWKIFSIGKANAEIDRLEAELAALKSAAPAADTRVSELTASNEATAAQLTQATADLGTARQTIGTVETLNKDLSTKLSVSEAALGAVRAKLGESVTALKLDVKAGAAPDEIISAMQAHVSTTLAKLSVDASAIPAALPGKGKLEALSGIDRAIAAHAAAVSNPKA